MRHSACMIGGSRFRVPAEQGGLFVAQMHDPDQKATVLAALLAGHGISETARQTGVPKPTVIRWRDEMNGPNSELFSDRSWLPERGVDWQDNFQRYIDDSLYALRVKVAYLSRPEVLERTEYAAIVDAHSALADRIARIAESVGTIDVSRNASQLTGAPAA